MAATRTFIGDYIEIYLNNELIANGTSCKADFKFGKVKTTTKNVNSSSNTYDYSDSDLTVTADFLYATKTDAANANLNSLSTIVNAGKNKTKFTVKFGSLTSGMEYYSATILVDSASWNAAQKAEVTCNASFTADGDWVETTNP